MRLPDPRSLAARTGSALILAAPPLVLAVLAARYGSGLLAIGAAAGTLGALLFVRHREVWRPPASASVVLLYLMALGWVWFAVRPDPDGPARLARGFFLLAAAALVVVHDLTRTGLEPRRRAGRLCRRITGRTRWPAQLSEYHDLPDVRALQDAVRDDPGPALRLLADPRPEVRAAAFAALQTRPFWRAGEAVAVVGAVRTTVEPRVRGAGVLALSTATDPDTVAALGEFLRDPSADVRHAAAAALLTGGPRRWPLVRDLVRVALSDPALGGDGPLPGTAGRLPAMAVCDLTAWAVEPEPLAGRAVRTLVEHYAATVRGGDAPGLAAALGQQVLDPQTPPALRMELAALLRGMGLLPADLLDRMTDVDQPGPIRLLAAETLLGQNPHNSVVVDVLRGLGRQSHRETALAIARLLQTYLGLDMGLPNGPVAANSKAAVEATRRVIQWASGRPGAAAPPTPEPAWGVPRPPSIAGYRPTASPAHFQPPVARDSSGNIWNGR